MRSQAYFRNFLLVVVAGLMVVAGVNYTGDPAMLFARQKEIVQISQWIVEGQDVAILTNTDERLMQKQILSAIPEKEVLVFGSSRVMAIGEELFPGQTFYNAGVSGGAIEDMIGLLSVYQAYHASLPKTVIIGLEPWLLNKNNDQHRYQSIRGDYERGLRLLRQQDVPAGGTIWLKKYEQLLSLSYLKASVRRLRRGDQTEFMVALDPSDIPDTARIIKHDGSRTGSKQEREKTTAEVDAAVEEELKGSFYSMEHYGGLDDGLKEQFLLLVRYLRAHGVRVICYEEPYHPLAYQKLSTEAKYRALQWADDWFTEQAAHEGYFLVGSYNPQDGGLTADDFTDFMHMRRERQERYVQNLLEGLQ